MQCNECNEWIERSYKKIKKIKEKTQFNDLLQSSREQMVINYDNLF